MAVKIGITAVIWCLIAGAAQANVVREITTSAAQGQTGSAISVEVPPPEIGVATIDFSRTGEKIRQVAPGNLPGLYIGSDDPQCLSTDASNASKPCTATVLYLQQQSDTKPAVLTVKTNRALYIFRTEPKRGPQSLITQIQPEVPVLRISQGQEHRQTEILRGIEQAYHNNLVTEALGQRLEQYRLNIADGQEIEEAAFNAGISLQAIRRLQELGQRY